MTEQGRDIIVIGASAGGIEACKKLISFVPPDFPAAVFIVVHLPARGTSLLPRIFARADHLPAEHAQDGEAVTGGRFYVAPPDHHLVLEDSRVRVTRGPFENGMRPAVDVLFRSAARAYGPRVIGVILSGSLHDGTLGLRAVKEAGGLAVVQTPSEAAFPDMPQSAIENVPVDYVLPLAEMGPLLVRLAREKLPPEWPAVEEEEDLTSRMVREDLAREEAGAAPDGRSIYTCPDCGGALWEVREGRIRRYRCHVGHSFSDESLLDHQDGNIEQALWSAVRALVERAALSRSLAARLEARGAQDSATRLQLRAEEAERRSEQIRRLLFHEPASPEEATAPVELPERGEVA